VQIEYFRAARYLSTVSVSNSGTQITVDWDYWEFCDEDVFTPLDTALSPDPIPGVDQVRRVRLDIANFPGRYTFTFSAHNSSSIDGTVEMSMHDGDLVWGRPDTMLHPFASAFTIGFATFQLSRVYPMLDPFGSGTHIPEISFTLAQNSATNPEEFSELMMEISYDPNVNICPPGSS
jgi:hypothetical protein